MSIVENLRRHKHFCASIGSVNLGALCVGLALGWPKPLFTFVYEPAEASATHSMLYLDASWIESIIIVGASLGGLASILISGFYGRRISFALSGAILVGFWIFLDCSGLDKVLIISAAAVAGLGVGIFSATAVLYVAEISTRSNRGVIGTTVILFGYLGIFTINLLGYLFDTSIMLSLMAAPPICFLASIHFFMIESPFHQFQKGEVLRSKISLKNLRNRRHLLEIDEEYKSMECFFNRSFSETTSRRLLESLCPESLRPLRLIAAPVLYISQMFGVLALSDYAEHLIETPYMGGLVTSFIDVVFTALGILAIERLGGRWLLIFTIVASGLCCLTLAAYQFIRQRQCNAQELVTEREILPIVVLCIYYGIYALGLTPVLPVVTGEIFPCRAKMTAVGISTSLIYLVAFCVRRSYVTLNQYTSSCFAFACFAIMGSIGLPFAVAVLPQTPGKSSLQIKTELSNSVVINC